MAKCNQLTTLLIKELSSDLVTFTDAVEFFHHEPPQLVVVHRRIFLLVVGFFVLNEHEHVGNWLQRTINCRR